MDYTHQSEWSSSIKSTNNKFWRGYGEKEILLHCLWESKLIQPLWKVGWRFLKKLGIRPPYDPAIPLLGIYLEETKVEKDTCIPLFIAALFTIARTWKQPRCPLTDEWIKKLWYIYAKGFVSCCLSYNKGTLLSLSVLVLCQDGDISVQWYSYHVSLFCFCWWCLSPTKVKQLYGCELFSILYDSSWSPNM